MVLLILIGILIGLVLGLTGAGGSVFAVPLLIYFGKLPITDAMGIALGAVFASTFYASLVNWVQSKKRHPENKSRVLWIPGFILAASGMLTAPLGKWISFQLPDILLICGYSILAALIALRMWWAAMNQPEHVRIIRAGQFADNPPVESLCKLNPAGQFLLKPRCVMGLVIGGATVGVLSGLFGVGGGFLIVPLLLMLSAVSMAQAVGTSLLIISVISATGFLSHLVIAQHMNWFLLSNIAAGGVIGMILGQYFGHKIANLVLQKIFAVSLFLVSLFMVIDFVTAR